LLRFPGAAKRPVAFGLRSLVAVLIVGCGDGGDLDRVAVSGKVTLDGQPLARGSIQFAPRDGDSRAAAFGEVVDGSYSIPAANGPAPGAFSVTILPSEESASDATAITPDGSTEMPGDPPPDALGEPTVFYKPTTPMEATVAAGAANTFDFGLSATKAPASRARRR
jgi:hypothetical protein